MKVGITYDLRADYLAQGYSLEETAEFDSIDTIIAIETALQKQGCSTQRIGNIKQLVPLLAQGQRWDLVFNIAEGLHGIGREAQIPALLEAYQIPCTFSDSVTLGVALDKGLSKSIIRDHAIPTAPFKIIRELADLNSLDLAFPVFAKPIAEGTGKGITPASYINSMTELKQICHDLLERYQQPILVETYLAGREFTVGIIGMGVDAQILGIMEIVLRDDAEKNVYSFVNKEYCEKYVDYRLASDAEAQRAGVIALAAWRALNCRDAGRVDLRSTAQGEPQFLEVNPLAGLHPTHSDLVIMATLQGHSYDYLLSHIMSAVGKRLLPQTISRRCDVMAL